MKLAISMGCSVLCVWLGACFSEPAPESPRTFSRSAGLATAEGGACDGLTYFGRCSDELNVRWCEDGTAYHLDCAKYGLVCGWKDATIGNSCVASPPEPTAEQQRCKAYDGSVSGCDANGCAYYFCSASCWPGGTPIEQACTPRPTDFCRAHDGDVAGCDAAGGCGYFFCSESCWPQDTAMETACPAATFEDCSVRENAADCTLDLGCVWNECSQWCWPAGAPLGEPCCDGVTYAGACDGDSLQWCDQDSHSLASLDCAEQGKTCDWSAALTWWDCVEP